MHVAKMKNGRGALKMVTSNPTGNKPIASPKEVGRAILELILKNVFIVRIGLLCLRIEIIGEHS